MKHFFKKLLFSILLFILPSIECSASAGLGIADAFKDLSEAELLKAIEESQKALEDLMTNGTPEQKAEFEKALTELAENLSPEDWKELQAIGEVYEKNNPYIPQEAPKDAIKPAPVAEKKPEVKSVPEKTKNSQFEASLKEALDLIIKNIDHMFHILSAHRDLSHKLKLWEEKSSFHELKSLLIRLKKHLNRLSNIADTENKTIIDNLYAFKKDLEAENKKIALAQDDFGLENPMTEEQSDHTLTRVTLVLSTGINNLLPSLTSFFKKYEPAALEEAKKKDAQKAKAKEHEKTASQRRPSSPYFSTAPSRTSGNDSYNQMPQRRYRPSDMHNGFHQGNNQNSQQAGQKEHKPDFGGFNMNMTRGTISGGKAIPNPEKKKDDKNKKEGEKEESSDSDTKKKSETKQFDQNQDYIKNISKYISEHTTKFTPGRFADTLSGVSYPKFDTATKTTHIPLAPNIKIAINTHITTPDIDKLRKNIIAAMQTSAQSALPATQEIIQAQANSIIDAIQEAQNPTPDEDGATLAPALNLNDVMDNAQVKEAIEKAAAAIQFNKDMENKEKNSETSIKKLEDYMKFLQERLTSFDKEIDDITVIINGLQPMIGRVKQDEVAKLVKNPIFTAFETKVEKYEKAVQEFRKKAEAGKKHNDQLMLITPSYESKYLEKHRAIFDLPKDMANKIITAKNSLAAFKQSAKLPYLIS